MKSKVLLLLVAICLTANSCFSQENTNSNSGTTGGGSAPSGIMPISISSPAGKVEVVNLDSIFQIIDKAKVVDVKSEIAVDSLVRESDTVFSKLSKDQTTLISFLFKNPNNFKTNVPVFGKYYSNVLFHFKKNNKEELYLSFDFALNKFKIIDKDMNVLATYDLDGQDMLRFVQSIYPDSQFLKNIPN